MQIHHFNMIAFLPLFISLVIKWKTLEISKLNHTFIFDYFYLTINQKSQWKKRYIDEILQIVTWIPCICIEQHMSQTIICGSILCLQVSSRCLHTFHYKEWNQHTKNKDNFFFERLIGFRRTSASSTASLIIIAGT